MECVALFVEGVVEVVIRSMGSEEAWKRTQVCSREMFVLRVIVIEFTLGGMGKERFVLMQK